MSRIGVQPITVPSGVTVDATKDVITVKGPKGELSTPALKGLNVEVKDNEVVVTRGNDEKKVRSFHGLLRSLIANMVKGVTDGFEKKLEVNGVGYKVGMQGKDLKLALGFSHDVIFKVPEGIEVTTEAMNIIVKGIDKQQVGQVAAEIRKLRKPEPYKGKGIKYADEHIIRKAGKTAGAGAA